MTGPTTMPRPSPEETPGKKDGRRVLVWWAVALTLLALLGIFCWAVVIPCWRVRNEVRATVRELDRQLNVHAYSGLSHLYRARRDAVTGLGGPEAASRKIRTYLRLPGRLAPDKDLALKILSTCEETGVPVLAEVVAGSDEASLRAQAAFYLGCKGKKAAPAVAVLEAASRDRDPEVAAAAAQALKEIKAAQERPKQ